MEWGCTKLYRELQDTPLLTIVKNKQLATVKVADNKLHTTIAVEYYRK